MFLILVIVVRSSDLVLLGIRSAISMKKFTLYKQDLNCSFWYSLGAVPKMRGAGCVMRDAGSTKTEKNFKW